MLGSPRLTLAAETLSKVERIERILAETSASVGGAALKPRFCDVIDGQCASTSAQIGGTRSQYCADGIETEPHHFAFGVSDNPHTESSCNQLVFLPSSSFLSSLTAPPIHRLASNDFTELVTAGALWVV